MTQRSYRRRPLFNTPVPKTTRKPKMKWKVFPILWLALRRVALGLGFMVLASILLSVITVTIALQGSANTALPEEMVLTLEFSDGLTDIHQAGGFADPFAPLKPTVQEIVETIYAAKEDPRVHGILARMKGGNFSPAHIQEIRTALKAFQDSGKFSYIYSSSYGGAGGGLGRYYLASAFDELWMQPLGVVSIPGIHAEMPFARELLDYIGISPQFYQRHEYKTAYESLTNTKMSPANQEALVALISDLRNVLSSDIARDRNIERHEFSRLVDLGLLTSDQALEAGLIDKSDYADVLLDRVLKDISGKTYDEFEDKEQLPLANVQDYYADLRRRKDAGNKKFMAQSKPKIALVHVNGAIMSADQDMQGVANAAVIAPAILEAADDEDVKAIVVRVDSPGGSPVASESILRALEKAQKKDKPVIISMGPTAASGGYWVAAKADHIFVLPTTITGSIGVVGGKFAASALMDKVGVNWQGVQWGENAGIWSMTSDFSETEAQRVNMMLDHVYDSFLDRVAEGRKMERTAVNNIAKGRVWSGVQAVQIGLADDIGGLEESIQYAMQLQNIKNRDDVQIEIFPKPKTPLEQFVELFGGQVRAAQTLQMQASILEWFNPVLKDISVRQNIGAYQAYSQPVVLD